MVNVKLLRGLSKNKILKGKKKYIVMKRFIFGTLLVFVGIQMQGQIRRQAERFCGCCLYVRKNVMGAHVERF